MACEHKNVDWQGIETEYRFDGTAEVWQQGTCKDCKSDVILSYEPGIPEIQE